MLNLEVFHINYLNIFENKKKNQPKFIQINIDWIICLASELGNFNSQVQHCDELLKQSVNALYAILQYIQIVYKKMTWIFCKML